MGRWDFAKPNTGSVGANWLGVTEKGGNLDIWFQPTGGHVYQVKDFKADGSHLTFTLSNNVAWNLDASGGKLTGTETHSGKTTPVSATRAPAASRGALS